MQKDRQRVTILMVDDDAEDCLIMKTAFQESSLEHDLICFENGQEMMDYLKLCGKDESSDAPCPDLILLDLNMPRKDGRVVLYEIKNDPNLKDIPVVVLTDSDDAVDAIQCYKLGASLFYTKSQWLEILVEVISSAGEYWFDFASKVGGAQLSADERQDGEAESGNPASSYLSQNSYFQEYQKDSHGRVH